MPGELDDALAAVLRLLLNKTDRTGSDILEARDLVAAIYAAKGLKNPTIHENDTNSANVFPQLQALFQSAVSSIVAKQSQSQQERFRALVSAGFYYELSQADVERIQTLINELRDLIHGAEAFEKDHKRRMLERLENLQRELHRRLSNVDRFYGLVGEAGVALGKFGKDAKPFVDRIREILEIIWRSQASAERLPASAKPALLTTESEPETPS